MPLGRHKKSRRRKSTAWAEKMIDVAVTIVSAIVAELVTEAIKKLLW